MAMIRVYEGMLEALLELLLKTNDCLVVKEVIGEEMPCDRGECAEEYCPYFNVKNLIEDLKGDWGGY